MSSEVDPYSNERVAIVIVTRNREQSLLRTLAHLKELERPYPIVVVDNASSDGTRSSVRRNFPDVQLIARTRNIGAVARNDGVRAVDQPYIAFTDDDSWWRAGALLKAIELLDNHPSLALIMSRVLVGVEEALDPCCELMQRSPLPRSENAPGTPIIGFLGCGAVVRRSAFLAAGGFNERFGTGGEEALLSIDLARSGWRLAYVEEIVSHHFPSKDRDEHVRKVEGVRVLLWTAWLRRSLRRAARVTAQQARPATTSLAHLIGFAQALGGFFWVWRERIAVEPELERQLVMLERQRELGLT